MTPAQESRRLWPILKGIPLLQEIETELPSVRDAVVSYPDMLLSSLFEFLS